MPTHTAAVSMESLQQAQAVSEGITMDRFALQAAGWQTMIQYVVYHGQPERYSDGFIRAFRYINSTECLVFPPAVQPSVDAGLAVHPPGHAAAAVPMQPPGLAAAAVPMQPPGLAAAAVPTQPPGLAAAAVPTQPQDHAARARVVLRLKSQDHATGPPVQPQDQKAPASSSSGSGVGVAGVYKHQYEKQQKPKRGLHLTHQQVDQVFLQHLQCKSGWVNLKQVSNEVDISRTRWSLLVGLAFVDFLRFFTIFIGKAYDFDCHPNNNEPN